MGVTKDLVKFCYGLESSDLPRDVIQKAKYFLLDFTGVAAAGSKCDSSKIITDFAHETKGDSTIIGDKVGTAPYLAALANGAMAHALEIDDTSTEASLHPGAGIFPTALAASEIAHCDGKKFIAAVVAGYEATIRIGKAVNPTEHYSRGLHSTGTCGVFGATVTASKLLGLDEEKTMNAFGIAGHLTSGSMAFLQNGAWSKRINPGWAAHNGIIAAKLAARGFNGPWEILEGKFGFLSAVSSNPNLELLTNDLGKSFQIAKTSIKNHACCRYKQSALDAVIDIVSKNNLQPRDIEKVNIQLVGTAISIVVEPKSTKYNPKNVVDAQFSMPFGAAVAILRRKAFIDEYQMDLLSSGEVKDLMQKVECEHNPELDKDYPEVWPSIVKIETTEGRVFEERVDYPKGDPENPLTWEELTDRFDLLAKTTYPEDQRRKIKEIMANLEKVENVGEICQLLR
jgi:2-methylcitrate dehydratase PrpD